MKKVLLKALALLLLALIPFGMLASAIAFMPSTFEKTFLGALSLKYDRLSSLEGEKMIVIGGSSVAFGLDSEMLCELVGMPVVNFGLYASLGTKVMMNMAMGEIERGDVVVLAPELDAQTLSLYFNAESAWQAVDADKSLLWAIGTQNFGDMMGGAVGHLVSKIEYFGETLDPQGVYNRASFDEYGDIVFSRPYNVMTFGYDVNKTISISEKIYSIASLCAIFSSSVFSVATSYATCALFIIASSMFISSFCAISSFSGIEKISFNSSLTISWTGGITSSNSS